MELIDTYWREYPDHVRYMMSAKIKHQFRLLGLGAGEICDVGGGWGGFACYAASMGLKVTMIDDFGDPGQRHKDVRSTMPAKYGVRVVKQDILKEPLPFIANSIDAFTCFDVLEHLHASPKALLHNMKLCLKPGGTLLLGLPNCVNLRKRITVPLGFGKWSAMREWYESPVFRSHVREPDVSDLRYIARDLGLQNVRIKGANFSGFEAGSFLRAATRIADPFLRLRPSLCADLYLIGEKAHGSVATV
jgi:SAM-dependent methyltransferase